MSSNIFKTVSDVGGVEEQRLPYISIGVGSHCSEEPIVRALTP